MEHTVKYPITRKRKIIQYTIIITFLVAVYMVTQTKGEPSLLTILLLIASLIGLAFVSNDIDDEARKEIEDEREKMKGGSKRED